MMPLFMLGLRKDIDMKSLEVFPNDGGEQILERLGLATVSHVDVGLRCSHE